jgi:hypothetical protein
MSLMQFSGEGLLASLLFNDDGFLVTLRFVVVLKKR